MFMFTLDGVPLIYNGMEVGDATEPGAQALFEKLTIFWPVAERRPEFSRFYKQMIALRHDHSALRRGSLEWLHNSDEARIVTFLRRVPDEEVLVAINFSNQPVLGSLEVGNAREFKDITPEVRNPLPPDAPPNERASRARVNRLPTLALEAWGYRILRRTIT